MGRSGEAAALYIDFTDPLSFAVSRILGQARRLRWRGFERFPAAGPRPELETPRILLAADVLASFGPSSPQLRTPPFTPWSGKAHELWLHAKQEGKGDALRDALMEGFWFDSIDIGRIDLLLEIANNVGLDAGLCGVVLGVDRYACDLIRERRDATRRGVSDTPSLLLGSELRAFPQSSSEIHRWIQRLQSL